ncbi:hypothetical protein A176_000877 [Myxococcus hansupus]|uniref:Uncharacterized protein n=1 Tax=Pseudomyxococcus hansupus TaxID=1297742 RepID=A0A0H4WRJ2_9BACT|nr:hypothetical protein [Myxococcus hansupus]AKQ63965.1 hypothetical protein A176_000877 [Myxococcus hansupus]
MRNKKGVSVALLLLAVSGVTLASQRAAPDEVHVDEPVCVATGVMAREAPGPLAACPSFCGPDRVACLAACNGDVACRGSCQDAYISCCGF